MSERKPYANPVVRSVSRQKFCAHCIDRQPIGKFTCGNGEFELCGTCATFLTKHKLLPPVIETGLGLALINSAKHIPDLDELDALIWSKASRREWLRRDYEG